MKIGIITHYYKSINYGGNLQAFALCKVLKKMGYNAEQICYADKLGVANTSQSTNNSLINRILRYVKNPKILFKGINIRIYNHLFGGVINNHLQKRQNSFVPFNSDVIPHSNKSYNNSNIQQCNEIYDVFITGSDQVWNLDWFSDAYFLNFADNKKIKLSYAASIAKQTVSDEEKVLLKENINNYLAVSVREKSSVDLLNGLVDNVQWCLDPTLLLDSTDWDEITSERMESQKYVFGFFISGNKRFKKTAKMYALKKGLKYIELPFSRNDFRFKDNGMYDISPSDFLSLIKYADCIFTDSFHASVFSIIYKRDFFTFARTDSPAMSVRISDLADMFNCPERICNTKAKYKFKYLDNIKSSDYINKSEKYQYMKEKSIAYLKDNLDKASLILNKNED